MLCGGKQSKKDISTARRESFAQTVQYCFQRTVTAVTVLHLPDDEKEGRCAPWKPQSARRGRTDFG